MDTKVCKKKYLIITPFFPTPESWRGAYCYDFVKALMRTEKYDVRVFVPGDGPDYDYQGVHVYRFKEKRLPSNLFPFLFRRRNQRAFLNKVNSIGIDLQQVAVCHGHTANYAIYPLTIKQANAKCLTLLHHHDLQSFGLNNGRFSHCWMYNIIQYPILRYYHEQMDAHVFISEQARRSFLAAPDASWTTYPYYKKQMRGLGGYRSPQIKRSTILHNGVDCSIFKPLPVDATLARSFTIGCIGNFSELKDQMGLLKALSFIKNRLGDWRLVLVGSGAIEPMMRDFIRDAGMETNVEFLKEVDHKALPDLYHTFDLFVLPSWFEGFGCVFTEAYACGVPFITCEGQGINDIIKEDERALWLCKQRDAHDLAEKILFFYQNRLKQHLAKAIDINELVCEFLLYLENVISSSPHLLR